MQTAKPADWKTEALPAKRATIALLRTLSAEDMKCVRRGLVPRQMEDKWFIYWENDALHFHRSWTGFCIYIVRFAAEASAWNMVEADVNRDPEQHQETDDARDAALISYLLDVLLLHRDTVFPDSDPSSAKSALGNWSLIGRAMLGQHPDDDDSVPHGAQADGDKP